MSLIMSGVLAIGYGEKCPYCDLINKENGNFLKHMTDKHPAELEDKLFKEEK